MFKRIFVSTIFIGALVTALIRRDALIAGFLRSLTVQAMQPNPGIVQNILPSSTLNRVQEFSESNGEIVDFLGHNENKKYLVALMNTSEKRPDGGFFGSYAILELGPSEMSVNFYDSYYPQTVKKYEEPLDQWSTEIFKTQSTPFVGANMIGFTDYDGAMVKRIYDETFDDDLDGVIFVKSDLFSSIIDGFDVSSQKWEFLNATVDLRRGENLPNKKEDYLRSINKTFEGTNMIRTVRRFMYHLPNIVDAGNVRVYLPHASLKLTQQLTEHNLMNLYDPSSLYVFEYNLGFNKADKFVKKTMVLQGSNVEIDSESDRLGVPVNQSGYTLSVNYYGEVPRDYTERIRQRVEEEEIQLTQRELTILSLDPQWHTLSLAYLPKEAHNITFDGNCMDTRDFITPFAKVVGCSIASDKEQLDETRKVSFAL